MTRRNPQQESTVVIIPDDEQKCRHGAAGSATA
ncbi:hypothetical protein J2X34_005701 [Rhodococcus sp. BE178]